METIFDHGITDAEQLFLFGVVFDKSEYLSLPHDADGANGAIYHLYYHRNDLVTANIYLDKIKDATLRFDLQQNDLTELVS